MLLVGMKSALLLTISIIICLAAGFLGSIFTQTGAGSWYSNINKPSFNPPGWLFGPVWTFLFILMGISLFLILKQGFSNPAVKTALLIFAAQFILNILWSALFFGMHSPLAAFIEIVILWIFILWTILAFYPISRPASYLLIPYILWVSFAAILNFSIFMLNKA
jgi:tryptophan-rich sensory protein